MSEALKPFVTALFEALEPFNQALQDPVHFQLLIARTGWQITWQDTTLGGLLDGTLATMKAKVAALISDGIALVNAIETGNAAEVAANVVSLIDKTRALVTEISSLDTALGSTSIAGAVIVSGAPWSELWKDLAASLPGILLIDWLETHQPVLHGILRLGGVIVTSPEGKRTLDLEALGDLLQDPAEHLQALYGWSTDPAISLDHGRLLAELGMLFLGAGVQARLVAIRQKFVDLRYGGVRPEDVDELDLPFVQGLVAGAWTSVGLAVVPVPVPPGDTVDGLLLTNLTWGRLTGDVPLTADGNWKLSVTGTADSTGAVGLQLHPLGVTWAGDPAAVQGALTLTITGTGPWSLMGAESGTRLELENGQAGAEVVLSATLTGPAEPAFAVAAAFKGLRLVVTPGDGDSLLQELLPIDPLTVDLDLNLGWSTGSGFTFGASGRIERVIPLSLPIGFVTLEHLTLSLALEGGVGVNAGLTITATLGPFSLSINGIGLTLLFSDAADATGICGPVDVNVGFLPPTGLGISIQLPAVTGGGFLDIDAEAGRYVGGLQLEMLEVGITAFGVIDTKLPEGWAMLLGISTSFSSIPLGFGFILNGVGGLIAANRTLDEEALALGLKEGVLDALMFPDDIVTDLPRLLPDLDGYFPIAPGSFVIGPYVELGWGAPIPLITAQVGVVLALPDGIIAVLGSVASELPTPELKILSLHMDVLGAVDIVAGTVLVMGSIYDSKLLGIFELSGDFAFYLCTGTTPYFVLSAGGYNPHFQPPAGLPAVVRDLQRMRVEVPIGIGISAIMEAYFAVTSNTVQFGAHIALEACVEIWPTTYCARGDFELDVLMQFNPFAIIAEIGASVEISAGEKELWGIWLNVHLEGPKPWYAFASVEFKFFGFKVHFELDVGSKVGKETPETFALVEEVRAALEAPGAWSQGAAAGPTAAVISLLEAPTDTDEVWVRPDYGLEVRQHVAPLNRDLDVYGAFLPDTDRISVDDAGIEGVGETFGEVTLAGVSWEVVQDDFAPAQFDDMSNPERLGAPSFEKMDCGIAFSVAGFSFVEAEALDIPASYEETVIYADESSSQISIRSAIAAPLQALAASPASHALSAGRASVAPASCPTVAVSATSYAIASSSDGVRVAVVETRPPILSAPVIGGVGTPIRSTGKGVDLQAVVGMSGLPPPVPLCYSQASRALRSQLAANPTKRGSIRVVPTHALMEESA